MVKKTVVPDSETLVAAIRREMARSREGRYFHRLHVISHVLSGVNPSEAARFYGLSPRTVEHWVHSFVSGGLNALDEKKRAGRPSRLAPTQKEKLRSEMRRSPGELGYDQDAWDCVLLSKHLKRRYSVSLSVRQCRRLIGDISATRTGPGEQAAGVLRAVVDGGSEEKRGLTRGAVPAVLAANSLTLNRTGRPLGENHFNRDGVAAALRRSRIFSGLKDQSYAELRRLIVERQVKPGEFIYLEGDIVEWFYVILEGRIKISKHSPSGKDFIIALRGPEEMLGNVALFSDQPQPCSAEAMGRARLLAIRKDDLLSFLSCKPELAFEVLRRMLVLIGERYGSAITAPNRNSWRAMIQGLGRWCGMSDPGATNWAQISLSKGTRWWSVYERLQGG
ncbi:MAG: cyclic nucleotide-binding domain-containing protein [Chloroflexi bacterium]|nr:cyclic nucleotide-binding domain-containing protein [Chloroflexota bacterium]